MVRKKEDRPLYKCRVYPSGSETH